MQFDNLNSSMCNGVAVEGDNLLIRFGNDKVYRYINAASQYDNCKTAESAGKFVNSVLKANYTAERASEYE